MLLWIALALLTAAVLASVLAPLARPASETEAPGTDASAEAGARAVYRDQLAEIEAERAAGLIGAAEADAAKIEVSRRLLASAAARTEDAAPAVIASRRATQHGRIALATAASVSLLTLVLYLAHGSPSMPGTLATQANAARGQAELARMITQVETRLRQAPEDGKGWEVIAPIYLKLGRYADAAAAYTNAARLQGESARLLAGIAEASILAKDGLVTEDARAAYEKILKLEPGQMEPRFWLAMGKEQDGRLSEAMAEYTALLSESSPDAPYRSVLETRIKEVTARTSTLGDSPPPADKKAAKAPASPPSGPSAADMEAAAQMSPDQRQQMIVGMVDGLAQRLKRDGKDLAGWQRLLKAYSVLGRQDDARAALAEARRHFEGDTRALSDLSQLAATLGLGS
jgi:cytochrome c-type biogenesis protein CcmH